MKTFKQAIKKVSPLDTEVFDANIRAVKGDRMACEAWIKEILRFEQQWQAETLKVIESTPTGKLWVTMQANNMTALSMAFEYGVKVGRAMYDDEKV